MELREGKVAFAAKCGMMRRALELNGIWGRLAASIPNYTKYSDGEAGFVWTKENLDKLIADPKAILPDSPVAFR